MQTVFLVASTYGMDCLKAVNGISECNVIGIVNDIYPSRREEDGLIDWKKSPRDIMNFVRAQTRPYPGAYTIIDNKKVTIWDCSVEEIQIGED